MNFGFRYHLASLMAVFFSLILGILIGGALFPDHALVDEQAQLISELEDRIKGVQANLAALQGEVEFSSRAWSELKERVFLDKLATKTIILVDDTPDGDQSLTNMLGLAGAEVKKVPWEKLTELVFNEEMSVVFRLSNNDLPLNSLEQVNQLAQAGVPLSFVWDSNSNPSLSSLPPSLQVDSIDTSVGEIALLLGLITGNLGHYGMHKNAKGLFP